MSDVRAAGTSAVAGARRPVQIGLYLTNQHPVGADMVEALRGARSVVPTMLATTAVPGAHRA